MERTPVHVYSKSWGLFIGDLVFWPKLLLFKGQIKEKKHLRICGKVSCELVHKPQTIEYYMHISRQ